MYINQIDNLFDGIINNFNIFLTKKKFFNKIEKDNNFVKFQGEITNTIKEFIEELNLKEIEVIIGNKKQIPYIVEIIKRYCAFYIYLGIAFYYKGDRELFITNIIETSKNIKDNTFSISNFYNSDNNAKIIAFYQIIKDILQLKEFKTIERIKIILENDPIKYNDTINLLNNIGEDFFTEYFLIDDNFHNIIKTFIFRQIYLMEEKNDIIKILNESEKLDAEYKYIDIVQSKSDKIIDFTFLQTILSIDMLKAGKAEEYYEFLENYKTESELHLLKNSKMIDFLFSNKILIPITEDFLRYHKNTEKYEKDINTDMKERDATKIKYIINKVTKVMNLYSSIYSHNMKLKLEVLNLFYKSLEWKEAILYNDNEEVKIINKLEMSDNSTDLDYIIDLENIRRYAYLNFKELSKDGFKLRNPNMIQGVRYSNIKHINNNITTTKKRELELRMGGPNLPLNVVGIMFNPSNRLLECINNTDMVDIRTLNKNGFDGIIDLIKNNNKKDKKIYYWLFNLKIDKIKLEQYKNVSATDNKTVIENILGELYNYYMKINKIITYNNIKKKAPSNIWDLLRLMRKHTSSYKYIENMSQKLFYDDIIDKYIVKKLLNLKEIPLKKEEDKIVIKLKVSTKIKNKDTTIVLNKKIEEIDISNIKYIPICIHYIKWAELGKISRKNDEVLNQAIFDFVKQYVKINERNEYICKSCSELLDLKKYVVDATYVPELDTFLTTSLVTNMKLNEIPKYSKYTRTIRNIEKNLEKICYSINLNYYIGNTPIIKLRRKMIIKDVIDLILIHSLYLKAQPKDRIEKAVATYNIHPDLTNLFFFELKDEVFLTNSLDTDYYKIIKFNNVIAYILLILIIDLNVGQIINMKDDKRCNYFLYSKVGDGIFSKLYIRINEKEKIAISHIPLLAYTLFYMSCMVTNNMIWLWNNTSGKNMEYNIQKTIIHTIVDLMNTLIEANMVKDKNFMYELIVNRMMYKLKNTYMDPNAITLINTMTQSKIKIDDKTNIVSYIVKKEKIISLENIQPTPMLTVVFPSKCKTKTDILEILPTPLFNYNIDVYTNCPDGRFHEWDFKNDMMRCNLCDTIYDKISKDNIGNISRVDDLKMLSLRKLASTYCTSGELHEIDITTNKCTKCNVNVLKHQYTVEELNTLEKNLKRVNNIKIMEQLNHIRKYFEKENKRIMEVNNIILKMNERYLKYTNNKMINYIDDFIDHIIKNVGSKIKIDNNTIYLRDTIYIVQNDYLGNSIKNKIIILSSENKINIINNHPFFKINVIYYHDKNNNTFVFYDNMTKNYIGYSKDNKNFILYKSNSYIEVHHSIKDMLINFGLENQFYNIYHISKSYLDKNTKKNVNEILTSIIRTRCNNIKQCIYRSASIIEKIKNKYNKMNIYNIEENKLLAEFQRSLKDFNTTSIFKNIHTITSNININSIDTINNINNRDLSSTILSKQYIDTSILITLNNMDCKLLFYYLFNLNKLIGVNDDTGIRTNLCYMIIKIIIYCYKSYNIPIENNMIRRFDSILLNDSPYMDDAQKVVGYYMDLINTREIDDEAVKEISYDMNEEKAALDIDDYEKEDYEVDDDVTNEANDNDNYFDE